jgi:hypothetical protein
LNPPALSRGWFGWPLHTHRHHLLKSPGLEPGMVRLLRSGVQHR